MLKEKRKKKNITEKISETKNRCFRKQLTKFQISKKCAKEQKKEREREREKTQITNTWNNRECHY